MFRNRRIAGILATGAWLCAFPHQPLVAGDGPGDAANKTATVEQWSVTAGKSLVLDSPLPIERISVADGTLADAVAIGPKEVIINGKLPGRTSLIVWQSNGNRQVYDLAVTVSPNKLDAVREQVARECPNDNVEITVAGEAVFVRGTVQDVIEADRVMAIATTLGKPVNLLRVVTPPVEAQILVKVRFASVDRGASRNLSLDLASGALNQNAAIGPDQPISTNGGQTTTLSDAVNIFLFRKDINLTAAIQALESKNLLEMLAEPTVPAINGKEASFVAGGEFPFPVVQPGVAGSGTSITIAWREYGVRLNFLPVITPRGTIRLQVAPEVSSLDYTHAVTIGGQTIPALSKRRVQTEIELEGGQSFVIAGLIDNQTSDALSKIPGLGDIPILGKLFQSKITSRTNNELLVIVTPEIVRPIPEGQPLPDLKLPATFLPPNSNVPLRQPGMNQTGPVPVTPPAQVVPVEQVTGQQKQGQPDAAPNQPQYMLVPLAAAPATPAASASGLTGKP
jgi:pilus assembly protein CpaC